ncbi:DEAD/DEAH box helicase [Streptomyces sp. NPDC048106]|uniref:CRISPR-associated helicase/endonuclease Cas3 n=1 Tax=Streptomyces sp. NPDC048106 TaxID=3155750 RepID=UPI00345259EE
MGVGHKHAGTVLAERYTQLACATVVFGHHGGLLDPGRLPDELHKGRPGGSEAARVQEAIRAVEGIVPEIHRSSRIALPGWLLDLPRREQGLGLDLLVRMLFSCVVDADYLDTSAHFEGAAVRVGEPADMAAVVERYEARRKRYLAGRGSSPVDALRQSVYERACAAAGEPGVYVLQVPTDGAKTMAAGAFALRHAAQHGKRRVVLAVPFISITEQNAAVYRDLLDPEDAGGGPAMVLEHHSAVDLDVEGAGFGELAEEQREALRQRARTAKLAAENWDAPFVVTTTVRLFESLFSHKPSQMRRLHNLAGSVIILDEVQALPDRLLAPILSGLRGLVDHFGATVLLVSATQPSFWELSAWKGLERKAVIDDPAALFDSLRRVEYEWRTGQDVTLEARPGGAGPGGVDQSDRGGCGRRFPTRVPGVGAAGALQVPCSRRPAAATATDACPPAPSSSSTPQTAAGRAATSTAPRCRPGNSSSDRIRSPRRTISTHCTTTTSGDIRTSRAGTRKRGWGAHIQKLRRALDFPEVDREFQMIEDEHSVPVVVIRDERDREQIEEAVAQLTDPFRPCGPEVLRSLQQHTASLPKREADAALRCGLAVPVTGDLLPRVHAAFECRRQHHVAILGRP